MKSLTELAESVAKIVTDEQKLEKQLDKLEEDAVDAERESTPELARILLLHADLLRGVLEQSRRRWIRLSAFLGVVLAGCLMLLAWLALASR